MIVFPQGTKFTRDQIQSFFKYHVYIDEKPVAISNCLQLAEEYWEHMDREKHALTMYNGENDGTDPEVAMVGVLDSTKEHRYSRHTVSLDYIKESFILQHAKPYVPYGEEDEVPYAFYIFRITPPEDYKAELLLKKIEDDHRIVFDVSEAHQIPFTDEMQEAWIQNIRPGEENIIFFGINQNTTNAEFVQWIDDYDEYEFEIDVPPQKCPVPLK